MIRRTNPAALLGPFVLSLVGLSISPDAAAQQQFPFEEAELFFELNDTDGDLGLHGSIDGEPWTMLEIDGPVPGMLLQMFARGSLRMQGLTQLDFESAEPDFEELDPAEFFDRFPEGWYEFRARALEGGTVAGSAWLSHVLAAPPSAVMVNGVAAAESCGASILPSVVAPVIVSWQPVTASHPTLGKPGAVEISRYQFFVEGEERNLGVDLPPDVTQFEIPAAFTPSGDVIKFEIIARTDSGNNTAVESCFLMQ